MRKAIGALVASAMLVVLMAAPALADEPVSFDDSVTFTDINPCTGLEHEITRDFTVTLHEHQNNTVIQVESTVTTDDGFEGTGRETVALTKNFGAATFNFVVDNPDTGAKFTVKGNFKFDLRTGELRVDRFAFNCVKTG